MMWHEEQKKAKSELGRYPWCGAALPGWMECPARRLCLAGRLKHCDYPERRDEYYGELALYGSW